MSILVENLLDLYSPMRIWFLITSLFLSPVFSLAQGLVIENRVKDLGMVPAKGGCRYGANFLVKNVSSEPYAIDRASATCGSIVVAFTKDTIPAGEKGYVSVALLSEQLYGAINKPIAISSTGFENGFEVVYLRGTVVPDSSCGDLANKGQEREIVNLINRKPTEFSAERKRAYEEKGVLIPQPYFVRYQKNDTPVNPKDKALVEWLIKAKEVAMYNGQIEIQIESSASFQKDPSARLTPMQFAMRRAKSLEKIISNNLVRMGVPPANIKFEKADVKVKGPSSIEEGDTNPYLPYQYISARVR